MLFQDLPELGSTPVDKTEILVGDNGALRRTDNLFDELGDAEIVRLVLAKQTPNSTLDQHISDNSIHTRLDDTTVSPNTTWSSARVASAIEGSQPWFNLDSVPEGATNKYFTEARAKAVIAATTQGVTEIDHEAIATQLVSVLTGFNSNTFRYNLRNPYATTPTTVTVDGGSPTVDYFDVTPGAHNIQLGGGTGQVWVCDELAHNITINQNGLQVITPRLSLDAFVNGTNNKFWNNTTFADSPVAQAINSHLEGDSFKANHARIQDNNASSDTTWSSNKIINFIATELAENRIEVAAKAKSIIVCHETASSGQNATGYEWFSTVSGTIHTHYIKRIPTNLSYGDINGASISGILSLPPGSWLVYWDADMTLRAGLFASVTGARSYIALDSTPTTPVLSTPGVITNSGTGNISYRLVSRFSTTTAYNSSFQDTWLQPQSISGVNELYATVQVERVR